MKVLSRNEENLKKGNEKMSNIPDPNKRKDSESSNASKTSNKSEVEHSDNNTDYSVPIHNAGLVMNSISNAIIDMVDKQKLKTSVSQYYVKQGGPSPVSSIYTTDGQEMTQEERDRIVRKHYTVTYSCIHTIFMLCLGGFIYLNFQSHETRYITEVFSTCMCLVGLMWLIYFHFDLYRYKQKVMKMMMSTGDQVSSSANFALTWMGNESPPYRFLMGRHSGSFYLKIGLAAFCFGHLVNEGLQLGQQILDYSEEKRYSLGCGETSSIVVHIVRPLYSFYQLFIVFKYSNIVINRHKELARFGLMHIIATCLCFWFGTIVEDAMEDYHHKLAKFELDNKNNSAAFTVDYAICAHSPNDTMCQCIANAILSVNNLPAIPYLYPFTIEFNILIAGVWFIVWHNIGKDHHRANPHHFQHKIDNQEIIFQSNLVISADCHASNKGLFAGLLVLMSSIISIIVFFVAMSSNDYINLGISIHYFQEGFLIILALFGAIFAFYQIKKLDLNLHPITFLDDVLLFIPLPFFFLHGYLTIQNALIEYQTQNIIRILISVLTPIQVIVQTPLIIEGLRRCSNSQELRYKKPGREIITFLIVCNLTMWIINTFEAKSVEAHYGQDAFYGKFAWLFISHTTLPLMLFYRFHSSVCLADIWKSAYEKGE